MKGRNTQIRNNNSVFVHLYFLASLYIEVILSHAHKKQKIRPTHGPPPTLNRTAPQPFLLSGIPRKIALTLQPKEFPFTAISSSSPPHFLSHSFPQ